MLLYYVYYISGSLDGVAALLIFAIGIARFKLHSPPQWLTRITAFLCFVLVASSSIIFSAFAVEFYFAYQGSWAYPFLTFFAVRFGNWLHCLDLVAALLPQLFWFSSMRRRPAALACISFGVLAPQLYEFAVVAITQYALPR